MSVVVRSDGVRLSAFYAAFFAVIGVQQPFWPVWLESHGLGATEIGVALALSIGIKAMSAPLAAHFADRSGERRRLVLVLACAGLAAFCLFGLTRSFWPILLVSLVFYAVWPPVMSLVESITVGAASAGVVDYGRVRLWGSFSYIVVAVAAGQILLTRSADAVFWTSLGCVGLTVLSCFGLPDRRADRRISGPLPVLDALADRRFVRLLVACGLIQGSHAVYYAFATLHWRAAGYSELVIGALWAEGVIAEIVLFLFATPLLRRIGPAGFVVLAGAAAGLRWCGTGATESLWALVPLQLLHAFSFGAAHLGAMAHIGGAVPATLSATAQSLYSGLVWGVGLGIMLFVSGWLYQELAGGAFLAMAVAGLIGAVVAGPLTTVRRPPSGAGAG